MFGIYNNELNEEQETAINETDSLLLVACPGSGKTRTLTYKIALELSKLNSTKQFIVAITYTNAAADEIKERIEVLGVDISQLWIGTIHSFCLEWIIKPYYLYNNRLKNGFKVINSFDSEDIIDKLCEKYDNPKVTFYDCPFYATTTGYKISSQDQNKRSSIKEVLTEYIQILESNKQIDFEQILFYSYQLLNKNSVISSLLSKIFPFILIDEYQDTKEIQYHIIASILKAGLGNTKAFIVGDPNQSIYDTLGGYPMPKDQMENLFGFSLKEYFLTANYRSSSRIIEYFDNYKTFENDINPKGEFSEYKSSITYNNTINRSNLEDEIVRLILFNIKQRNISPNSICIAAPQWVHLASLTRSLMVKLPDYSFDGPGMAPFSRDIDNFWYKLSRIVLTEPSPDIYIRRLRWAKEILNELSFLGADISGITNKSFLKICNSIKIEELNGLKYLEICFKEIFDKILINKDLFPVLIEHHTSFFDSSKARIKKLKKEGSESINSIETFKKVFKQRQGIKISTIHGVKGTEFDTVIGFGLLDSWVPHFSDPNGSANSKKMLYVLSSRAKKNLHLISERGRNINRHNPNGLQPTPHLNTYEFEYNEI